MSRREREGGRDEGREGGRDEGREGGRDEGREGGRDRVVITCKVVNYIACLSTSQYWILQVNFTIMTLGETQPAQWQTCRISRPVFVFFIRELWFIDCSWTSYCGSITVVSHTSSHTAIPQEGHVLRKLQLIKKSC